MRADRTARAGTVPGRQVLRDLRSEVPFLVLLAAAAALRLAVLLAFRPVLWFYGDSYAYLGVALQPAPYDVRPVGYSFFLLALQPLHSLAAVAAVQHLLGLLVGAGVYVLLQRLAVPRWLALLACTPVLLDAHQVQLEQMLMAETLALALVGSALGLLLWADRPSPAVCAWAGSVLALAALTRSATLVLVVPVVGFLLWRRVGLGRVLLATVAFVLPLYLYASWFGAVHGERGLTAMDGFFLYGRVMTWASCEGLDVPETQVGLCDDRPTTERPGVEHYIWDPASPAYTLPGTRLEQNTVLRDFALQVVREQPLGYSRAVLGDLGQLLDPVRRPLPSAFTSRNYQFSAPPRNLPAQVAQDARAYQEGADGQTRPRPVLTRALAAYQSVAYLPSPLYVGAALLGLVGVVRGAAGTADRRRAVAALLLVSGAGQLLLPIAVQGFDYRYQHPALPLLPAAAALGLQLLRERGSRGGAGNTVGQEPVPARRPEPGPPRRAARRPGATVHLETGGDASP